MVHDRWEHVSNDLAADKGLMMSVVHAVVATTAEYGMVVEAGTDSEMGQGQEKENGNGVRLGE